MFAGYFESILADNSVNDQTKILVVNAAYFVGKWMKKFPESETKECPFRINKVRGLHGADRGSQLQVQKVTATQGTLGIHSDEGN